METTIFEEKTMDNNKGNIEIENILSQIENRINILNQLNLHELNNKELTLTCSKLIISQKG